MFFILEYIHIFFQVESIDDGTFSAQLLEEGANNYQNSKEY